jgi:type IV pilus assembly protein PilF
MLMLLEDPARTHVGDPDDVVELYESTNQPMVQPTGRAAQPAQAAVLAVRDPNGFQVLVVLTLVDAAVNVIYAGEVISELEIPSSIEEALLFAESMGFILDSTGWSALDPRGRQELAARLGCFRPPQLKKGAPQAERKKVADPLSAVARLFAAFSLLLWACAAGCTGPSTEQRKQAAEIHYDLGTNMMTEGNAQGALGEYLIAEKEDPDLPQVQNALGLVYGFSLGRADEAEAHFKKALELQPDFSEASNNYGAFLLQRGRFADAIPQFEKALGNPLYQQRSVAECNLGWALYKSGKPELGLSRIRAALLVAPKYCKGWRQLGVIHSERAAVDDAAEAFDHYAQSCPDAADAHLQVAKIAARRGKADLAREALGRCVEKGREKDPNTSSECVRLMKELGAR